MKTKKYADVLIGCGQGVYKNGGFPVEYPDADVYLWHGMEARNVANRFRYNVMVLSGGLTQKAHPDTSEAEGMLQIMTEMQERPAVRPILETAALDSTENVLFGLMAARLALDKTPIRRIGVHVAWQFKKHRFNLLARMLDLHPNFYFHGLASHDRADAGERAVDGEHALVGSVLEAGDPLLLSDRMEEKRRSRFVGADYAARTAHYRHQFPAVFAAVDTLRRDLLDVAKQRSLAAAVRAHILLS